MTPVGSAQHYVWPTCSKDLCSHVKVPLGLTHSHQTFKPVLCSLVAVALWWMKARLQGPLEYMKIPASHELHHRKLSFSRIHFL